ncbi:uncharacterized protein LOC109594540 [Aethina tumida]|uniref:uncharacterized protein LOC109594540 n=1 Tax=Aethina tumida TaxID=116153 RepID=UPI0021477502|nr:uncharacterized protein LOC109594540 [Aethina tumida]
MSEINEERLLADENEAECFGISSTELVEDTRTMMFNVMQRVFNDISEELKSFDQIDEEKRSQLSKNFQEFFMDKLTNPFKKMETEIRNFMAIPEYKSEVGSNTEITENNLKDLEKENNLLVKEYINCKLMKKKCEEKLNEYNSLEETYQKVENLIDNYKSHESEYAENKKKMDTFLKKQQEFLAYYFKDADNESKLSFAQSNFKSTN